MIVAPKIEEMHNTSEGGEPPQNNLPRKEINRMLSILQLLQVPDDKQCLICRKPSPAAPEKFGKFFEASGKRVWLCIEDATPFFVGRAIGNIELNKRVIDMMLAVRPEDTGEALLAKIIEHVPDAAMQLYSRAEGVPVQALSPRTLYKGLSENVVGQDEAKRLVSVAVFNHVRSLQDHSSLAAPPKSHVLLLGPSGVGKTLLAHTTGRLLSLPFVSTDATGFSPTGFTGGDSDACVGDLLVKTHGIVEATERGVVLIDEVDKLAGHRDGSSSEHLNSSTQGTLLRLIEGKDVKVPSTLFGEPLGSPPIPVSTARMLFFLGGAFPGLSEIVAKVGGYGGRSMGLRRDSQRDAVEESVKSHEILASASHDALCQALIQYGMGAELIGRIPTIAPLAPLTKDELRLCLLDVPHAEVKLKTALFQESGYDLEFDEALIEKIVEAAFSQATGTRALQSLVARVVSRASFDLLGEPVDWSKVKRGQAGHLGRVVLTAGALDDSSDYRFTPRKRTVRAATSASALGLSVTA